MVGLVAARWVLVRSLSQGGKHLSQMETFIEKIPVTLSSTAGSVASNLPIITTSGASNSSMPLSVAPPATPPATPLAIPSATQESPASESTSITISDPAFASASPQNAQLSLPSSATPALSTKLKPAEIAYLVRGGDITHTLIVLVVDLIQRSVKTQDSSFSDGLADYEKNMWRIVTRSVKDWATQKVQQTVVNTAKNPIASWRRAIFLFNFIKHSLSGMISDTIADPRRLKRYFSPHGVLRIIADFTSSGYKQAFHEELRKSLLKRGLLVPEGVRHEVGMRFFIIGLVGIFATLVIAFHFCTGGVVAFITWIASLVAGFIARTLLALRHLVPYYEELAVVVDQIRRKSFRITIIKTLLRSVNAISWLALLVSLTVSLGIGFGVIKLAFAAAGMKEFIALVGLTVTHFAIADFLFNGVRLNIEECPTRIAEEQLEDMRKELEHTSPLETFSTLLASPNYDPKFSKILALYGVETLLILM